jgi:hypothetical protein
MANFTTHIGVGTVACGMLATLTLAADVVAPENLVAVTLAGVLGSVLPDIDLKDSRAGRAMFAGLAAFFSFAVLFAFAEKFSIAELWMLSIGTFLFFRYVVHAIFHRMSYHRGIYHSVLAGLFFAFVTAIAYYYVLGRHEGVSWLAGGFMFIGYMIHLVLDEIYSVDVLGTRVKRSFGTALKIYDGRRIDRHDRRDRRRAHADAADKDVRRWHDLARYVVGPAPADAAGRSQLVRRHGPRGELRRKAHAGRDAGWHRAHRHGFNKEARGGPGGRAGLVAAKAIAQPERLPHVQGRRSEADQGPAPRSGSVIPGCQDAAARAVPAFAVTPAR